jgi:hypothetical protein
MLRIGILKLQHIKYPLMKILSLGSLTFSTHIDTNLNKPVSNTCTYKIVLNTVLEVGINILSKKINEAILQSLSH